MIIEQFNLNHVIMNDGKCVVKDGCVGMTLNCLNGKSFLSGRGRGMTNSQLCGSGNWETEDHPVIKSNKTKYFVLRRFDEVYSDRFKRDSQETPKRLPRDSQETPKRLPRDFRETALRLSED